MGMAATVEEASWLDFFIANKRYKKEFFGKHFIFFSEFSVTIFPYGWLYVQPYDPFLRVFLLGCPNLEVWSKMWSKIVKNFVRVC